MSQQYKVLISGEAKQMLSEHVYFLAQVDPKSAEDFRDEIIKGIRSLEKIPERYPLFEPENRFSFFRKMFIPKRYLVLYLIEKDTVYIEYILDCRQDYGWLIEE